LVTTNALCENGRKETCKAQKIEAQASRRTISDNSPIFNDVERAKKISVLIYQQQTEALMKLYE